MEKGFIENGFIVDVSNVISAADIVAELSNILDLPEAREKNICLKLGSIDLTQSQLLSIKSLIESLASQVAFIDTTSEQTELSAISVGLIVSQLENKIELPEIEDTDVESVLLIGEDDIIVQKTYETMKIDDEEDEKIEVVEKTEDEIEAEDKLEDLIDETNDTATPQEVAQDEIKKLPTIYMQNTLRSGQTMSYDGNVVIIGDVHPGSEVIAKGDITIWGVLGGIAHAGARGNDFAKIRALKLNAIQLRISGYYARRPDTLNIPFIQRSNEFTPETAVVRNGEISVFKTNEEE